MSHQFVNLQEKEASRRARQNCPVRTSIGKAQIGQEGTAVKSFPKWCVQIGSLLKVLSCEVSEVSEDL